MPAPSLFRAAAAALALILAGASGAAAGHRGGRDALVRDGGMPAMQRYDAERRRMHQGEVMRRRHGMHRRGMHPRYDAPHRFDGERPRRDLDHRRPLGERTFLVRPRRHPGYVERHHLGYRPGAFFARPAYRGHRWRQGYAPAYYPYRHGVSHGRGFESYRSYPPLAYGTVSGGSAYAPLYNRPAGIPAYACY